MITTDELVQLAEQIARELPEVSRNEWMRWMQVVERYGLERAVRHAEQLSTDLTMRPTIQRDNRLIARGMKSYLPALKRLTREEQRNALGYVAQLLGVHTLRGSLRPRGNDKGY